jgi:hypothetical protein
MGQPGLRPRQLCGGIMEKPSGHKALLPHWLTPAVRRISKFNTQRICYGTLSDRPHRFDIDCDFGRRRLEVR